MPRPPKRPDGVPKTKTRKNLLTGNTVTRTKVIGEGGRKEKTTTRVGENKTTVRKKTKYPTGYKTKETVTTRTPDLTNRGVPKRPDFISETVTRRKEKGVSPEMIKEVSSKKYPIGYHPPMKPPDASDYKSITGKGTTLSTPIGTYRRKAKETIKEGKYNYGSNLDARIKNKENLAGYKRTQVQRVQQGFDEYNRKISDIRKLRTEDPTQRTITTNYKKGGQKEMIKRADGSYSQRGLWDNIRANKGSGKKPTAQMLKQERKIKAKSKNK